LARRLFRRLKERPDVDVEAEIREGGRDDLLAAIVAILAHFGDEDARATAMLAEERLAALSRRLDVVCVVSDFFFIHALHAPDRSLIATVDFRQRLADLADRRVRSGRVDREREEV